MSQRCQVGPRRSPSRRAAGTSGDVDEASQQARAVARRGQRECDGAMTKPTLVTPDVFAAERRIGRHVVRQLLVPAAALGLDEGSARAVAPYGGWPTTLVADPDGPLSLLLPQKLIKRSKVVWIGSHEPSSPAQVLDSCKGSFHYGTPGEAGLLRRPQVGPLYVAQAHSLSSAGGAAGRAARRVRRTSQRSCPGVWRARRARQPVPPRQVRMIHARADSPSPCRRTCGAPRG